MWNLRFHCARRWQRHSNSFDHRPNFDLQTLLYLKPKTNIIPMSLKAPLLKKYKLKIWAWITTHIHCSMWYENTLLHPKFRDGLVSKCMLDWLFFFLHIIGIFRWHMQFNKRISLIRMTYIDKSNYIYIYMIQLVMYLLIQALSLITNYLDCDYELMYHSGWNAVKDVSKIPEIISMLSDFETGCHRFKNG